MLHFLSHNLDLGISEVLAEDDGLKLCIGSDPSGQQWLLYRGRASTDQQVWVCAPASTRALQYVRMGRASVRDALRHSYTGTVEIITVGCDHGTADRPMRGTDIPSDLLPPGAWHVKPAPRPMAANRLPLRRSSDAVTIPRSPGRGPTTSAA